MTKTIAVEVVKSTDDEDVVAFVNDVDAEDVEESIDVVDAVVVADVIEDADDMADVDVESEAVEDSTDVVDVEDTDVVDAIVEGAEIIDVTDAVELVDATDIIEDADVELPLFPVTIVLVVEAGMFVVELDTDAMELASWGVTEVDGADTDGELTEVVWL